MRIGSFFRSQEAKGGSNADEFSFGYAIQCLRLSAAGLVQAERQVQKPFETCLGAAGQNTFRGYNPPRAPPFNPCCDEKNETGGFRRGFRIWGSFKLACILFMPSLSLRSYVLALHLPTLSSNLHRRFRPLVYFSSIPTY